MKIEIKLITTRPETIDGFPLVLEISHQNKRKSKRLAFCKNTHFILDGKTISEKHPDYSADRKGFVIWKDLIEERLT